MSTLERERHASWLELFYDLVFASAVSEIGHSLYVNNNSILEFLGTISLFVPVWWAWMGVTFYAARFETDDVIHRIFVLLQMMGAAALTINIHGALAETSSNFAISYGAIRGFLVIEYLRTGRRIPAARKFANGLARGFLISTILWLLSAIVPTPIRFMIWALAIAVDMSTAILVQRKHVQLTPNIFHLPERMGLFTLIVIGETVFGLVASLSEHEWDVESIISIGAGLTIAFTLWWMYFDNVEGSPIRAFRERGRARIYIAWIYLHLPLVVGLVSTATGIRYIISTPQNVVLPYIGEWLICGSVAICLFSIGAIQFTTASSLEHDSSSQSNHSNNNRKKVLIQGSVYRFIAGFVIILIAALYVGVLPLVLILIITVICIIQIILDLRLHPHHRIF
ncbi:MAG TPA: low temperature requirement protein A [Nitrososphaeraceae archaeon]